jgi:hypothetical protein
MLRQIPGLSLLPDASWPEALLLVAALLVTVSTLALQVSLQSALMAAGVIGLVGGSAHWISYVTGVPFGPLQFPHAYGATPFQEWFFVPAVIWVVLLLNARGLARLILEGASKHPHHGYHLLALSILLMVAMAMSIEPFASTVHHYWLWGETRLPVTWQGVPLSCLFAWATVSVIGSFAAGPFLIDKHPRPRPPAREPAWIWALSSGLFAVGTAVHGLWPATIMAGVSGALAVGGAVRVWSKRATSPA